MFPFLMVPWIPTVNEKPPTLYSILNSIVNFNAETETKIKDLANAGRDTIFDFNYPLTSNISKQDFECMILNKFMMRRIGFETVTAFKLALNVKLNEIMPVYNKMFDMLEGWDLFNAGEEIHRTQTDSRNNYTTTLNEGTTNTTQNSEQNSNGTNNSTSDITNMNDIRYSDTPQSQLNEVQNGTYLSQYTYNTTDTTTTAEDTSAIKNTTQLSDNTNTLNRGTNNSSDSGNLNETITRTPHDKISIYKQFLENRQNIYTMIFKDIDSLFYQLF